jgi:murein DD-endopeptidase MepM/ murein hydrolase activator NlpD
MSDNHGYNCRPVMNFRHVPIYLVVLCALILIGCDMGDSLSADPARPAAPVETIPSLVNKTSEEAGTPLADVTLTPTATRVKSGFNETEKTPTLALPSPTPTPEFRICSPLEPYPIEELREITSAPYKPPPPGKEERHHGVDFSHYRRGDLLTIEGVGIQAVLPGKIAATLADTFPYGNVVIIETPSREIPAPLRQYLGLEDDKSIYSLYAHMKEPPQFQIDERVYACQPVGMVGKSGNTVEPHLHLETRTGPPGAVFTIMRYYQAEATEEEKAAYLRWRIGGEFNHFDPMTLLSFNSAYTP